MSHEENKLADSLRFAIGGIPGQGKKLHGRDVEIQTLAPVVTEPVTLDDSSLKANARSERTEKFVAEENPLDAVDQATYHFKLFMIDEASVTAQQYQKPETRVIIAESGVTTGILIESVELTTYVGQHRENRNKMTTAFEINLAEPLGATLIDRIYAASIELGVLNYTEGVYFLELSFLGRGPDLIGKVQSEDISPKKTWPIKITGIEATTDTKGTTYAIKAFLYSNLGFSNEHMGVTPSSLQFDSGKTVEDAFKALEKVFNIELQTSAGKALTFPDKMMIIVDPELGKLTLSSGEATNTSRTGESAITDTPKKIVIPKNYSLLSAINAILMASPEYVRGARDAETADEVEAEKKAEPELKRVHRVSTFAQHLAYDPVRNTPIRRFIFNITPYKTANLYSSAGEIGGNKNSTAIFDKLLAQRAIRKQYSYIFTGLNDQIIDFDLKFNFGWYVKRPPHGGARISREQVMEAAQFKDIKETLSIRKRIADTIAVNAKYFEVFGNLKEDDPLKTEQVKVLLSIRFATDINRVFLEEFNNPNISAAAKAALIQFVVARNLATTEVQGNGDVKVDFGNGNIQIIKGGIATVLQNPNRIAREEFAAGRLPPNTFFRQRLKNSADSNIGTRDTFISDYDVPVQRTSIVPVTYSITDVGADDESQRGSAIFEQDAKSGMPYIDSLFGQAFTGNGGDMITLELQIKGDPFWIETSPLYNLDLLSSEIDDTTKIRKDINAVMNKLKTGKDGKEDKKLTQGGISSIFKQNYIIFTTSAPRAPSTEGEVKEKSKIYNGIYAVNVVKSHFENGKFTQDITAYRELSVSIEDLRGVKPQS